MSSLFWIEKLMKLVSISTWYGGPSDMLCEKKRDAGVCATLRTSASFRCRSSFANWFGFGAGFLMRASFGEIIRLTAAKAFVLPFFCLPIAAREAGGFADGARGSPLLRDLARATQLARSQSSTSAA
eukprot:CAMPEP_0185375122 /NCGR_PEP_ID=MMETSP1364-20130426/35382_1 /TAXON_ID=38817 /ORGANISM="Gephyrocapsa oceanica, Strain RCC1303" /LENGTH=126 /DNA_ID=CAMNT_0027976383 /DNA_START=531 /DNA_END=909 /DNA_ORIENTATION=-